RPAASSAALARVGRNLRGRAFPAIPTTEFATLPTFLSSRPMGCGAIFIRGAVKPRPPSGRGYKAPLTDYSGVFCCSMYALRTPIGAPPQLAAKYDGDQSTPLQ